MLNHGLYANSVDLLVVTHLFPWHTKDDNPVSHGKNRHTNKWHYQYLLLIWSYLLNMLYSKFFLRCFDCLHSFRGFLLVEYGLHCSCFPCITKLNQYIIGLNLPQAKIDYVVKLFYFYLHKFWKSCCWHIFSTLQL